MKNYFMGSSAGKQKNKKLAYSVSMELRVSQRWFIETK
jgi:hypothetical protein